jgi:hypothetical protein
MRQMSVADVRASMPSDTPIVSRTARETALRERRLRAQMRTIW